MIKIIASDMDGTLLDGLSKVPPETHGLIVRLRKLGVRFVVATGRTYDVLQKLFGPTAELIDFVAVNGGELWLDGVCVHRQTFSAQTMQQVWDIAREMDTVSLFMSDGPCAYLYGPNAEYLRDQFELYDSFERLSMELPSPEVELSKLTIWGGPGCDIDAIAARYNELMGDELVFLVAAFDSIDVTPVGTDKASGLQRVMDEYGIEASEVLAFGDAMNDATMLDLAGTAVAMSNALPELKEHADYVIGSCEEHAMQAELARLLKLWEAQDTSADWRA